MDNEVEVEWDGMGWDGMEENNARRGDWCTMITGEDIVQYNSIAYYNV